MSDVAAPAPRSTALSAGLAVVIALVVSAVGNTVVSLVARAAGASADFKPLQPGAYIFLSAIGLVAGVVGWLLIRRSPGARATLRWLVPTVVVLSWIPDVLVGAGGAMAHTSWTAITGLMVMHVVVASAAVATFSRLLPLPGQPR